VSADGFCGEKIIKKGRRNVKCERKRKREEIKKEIGNSRGKTNRTKNAWEKKKTGREKGI
jgi:hypothetical protein